MVGVVVGVDVGGTNTDAAVLSGQQVLGFAKTATTANVTDGMCRAICEALNLATEKTCQDGDQLSVSRIHIGTTRFVNAVLQRTDLVKVAVIRLCGTATRSLPPYCDFPPDLKQLVCGGIYLLDGGHEFDGVSEIDTLKREQVVETVSAIRKEGVNNVVISGVFSPVNSQHEEQVSAMVKEVWPEVSLTESRDVGQLGLLQRENAAVLNESLRPLCERTVEGFRRALNELGLTCPFYLTQNDGTLISAEKALLLPVHTFASGPTNSMRGAGFLSRQEDAVVVDIGGTSTDVGILAAGFPRESGTKSKVGGVDTNFRMPDVTSVGLGGGSLVKHIQTGSLTDSKVSVGPQSVGYKLYKESLVFGGSTLTSTDIAVAAGLADIGEKEALAHLSPQLISTTMSTIHHMVEVAIDCAKTDAAAVPVVLVGGGSIIIDDKKPLKGVTQIIKPPYYQVANAVGAALSQVSGSIDYVMSLRDRSRSDVIDYGKTAACEVAVSAGADPKTVKILDIMEVPLTYLPGSVTRIKVKAVGDLLEEHLTEGATWVQKDCDSLVDTEEIAAAQTSSSTGESLDPTDDLVSCEPEPEAHVDGVTGEWVVSPWDIECLSVGAGILGCGGGGDPHNGKITALLQLEKGKVIRVISPERMKAQMVEGDCVVPIAFMGAPTIGIERLKSGEEPRYALEATEALYNIGLYDDSTGVLTNSDGVEVKHEDAISYIDDYHPAKSPEGSTIPRKRRVVGLVSSEIGGANCLLPLWLGAKTGLPVVDCDGMGRAFPELQMSTPHIYGHQTYPVVLADNANRRAVVLKVDSAKGLEDHFRKVVVEMGCSGCLVERGLTKEEITPYTVAHSVSRAWRLGRAVLSAQKLKVSPLQAIVDHEGAVLLATGKVSDVDRQTIGGFARGVFTIEGGTGDKEERIVVNFQNENLVARRVGPGNESEVLACTPNLLSLVMSDNGQPIATHEVRYGLRVTLLAIPAPPELTTEKALKVVGPQAFGYTEDDVCYKPLGIQVQHEPVPRL